MSKLLYIQASPRKERSYSRSVADAYASAYQEKYPQDTVDTIDLFTECLPSFDGLAIQAKYKIMHGENHSPEELKAWQIVERVIERFKSADKYLLAVPMWNFGIPYRLKQYLDLIIQPGLTFSFSPESGYSGLVKGKPFTVVYARGGEYPTDSPMDFQKKYIDLVLGFIGFTDIKSIIVEPTLAGGPDTAKAKCEEAIRAALATL